MLVLLIEFLNSYISYHRALRQKHQHIEFLNSYIIYHRALREQHQQIKFLNSYIIAVVKPYNMKCTSLETLFAGAAVVKPYDI
jgi:Holliday junction resolvasome RuvABC endonuclease subunit